LKFRPESVVAQISPRAIMWLRAADDTVVPIAESDAMYAAAGEPKKLVTLPGLEHEDLYFDQGDGKRYRSLGCEPCTGKIDSTANTIPQIIDELRATKIPERSGRAQDANRGMEILRKDGYM
jgi:3'-phosphoadenosine 5'-phosphosulfate sulfotransferase (PAPS reductase)/FAD synthetase